MKRAGCPDLDPNWPDASGHPRGPVLCVLYPSCSCGREDQRALPNPTRQPTTTEYPMPKKPKKPVEPTTKSTPTPLSTMVDQLKVRQKALGAERDKLKELRDSCDDLIESCEAASESLEEALAALSKYV